MHSVIQNLDTTYLEFSAVFVLFIRGQIPGAVQQWLFLNFATQVMAHPSHDL